MFLQINMCQIDSGVKKACLREEGAEAGETLESNHSLNNLVVSFHGCLHPWKSCSLY